METNFFSQLDPMIDGFDLQVTIKKTAGKLTLAVFSEPRIDDGARKRIPPLNFVATAKELDEHFFTEIQKPMTAISAFSLEMKKFETQMAATEAETQRARKIEADERKMKSDAKVKLDKGKVLLEENKPRQAISAFQEALKIYPGYPEATKLLIQAKTKAGLGAGLFDDITEQKTDEIQDSCEPVSTESQSINQIIDQNNGVQSATIPEIAEASENVIIVKPQTYHHGSH